MFRPPKSLLFSESRNRETLESIGISRLNTKEVVVSVFLRTVTMGNTPENPNAAIVNGRRAVNAEEDAAVWGQAAAVAVARMNEWKHFR